MIKKWVEKYKQSNFIGKVGYLSLALITSPLIGAYYVFYFMYYSVKKIIEGFKERNWKKVISFSLLLTVIVVWVESSDNEYENKEEEVVVAEENIKEDDNKTNDNKDVDKSIEEVKFDKISEIDKYLEDAIKTNLKNVSLQKVEYYDDSKTLGVFLDLSDNLTKSLIMSETKREAKDVVELIAKEYAQEEIVDKYEITFMGDFIDEFGNEFETSAFFLSFNHDTLQKINWDNKDYIDIEKVADRAVTHNYYIEK